MSFDEAKKAALEALEANKAQQQKLGAYIQQLQSNLDEVDGLIAEVEKLSAKEKDILDVEEDVELRCIHVEGAVRVKRLTKFWSNPESPFYEDAMRRERYVAFTKARPWTQTERQALKRAVIAEHKRLYALQLKQSGHTNVLDAVQQQPDSLYEASDASELDWDLVSKKVITILQPLTNPRTAVDCKIQWLANDHPSIKKGPWQPDEIQLLRTAAEDARVLVDEAQKTGEDEMATDEPLIDWNAVSQRFHGTRTSAQCFRKWLTLDTQTTGDSEAARSPGSDEPAEGDQCEVPGAGIEGTAENSQNETPGDGNDAGTGNPVAGPSRAATQKPKAATRTTKTKEGGGPLWTPEEDEALLDAVKALGTSNWPQVASMLPFSRTSRQCADRYRLSINPSIRRARWTPEEDELLRNAVNSWGTKWHVVRDFVPGRTGAQCRERWCNILDPSLVKRAWTDEEDARLLSLREAGTDWPNIAAQLGGRTDNQCWRRWKMLHRNAAPKAKGKGKATKKATPGDGDEDEDEESDEEKDGKRTKWTAEEDQRLIQAREIHKHWKDIAKVVGGGRTAAQCSNRWRRLKPDDPPKADAIQEEEEEEPQPEASTSATVEPPAPARRARPKPRMLKRCRPSEVEVEIPDARAPVTPQPDRNTDATEVNCAAQATAEENVEQGGIRSRLRKRRKVQEVAPELEEDDAITCDPSAEAPSPKKTTQRKGRNSSAAGNTTAGMGDIQGQGGEISSGAVPPTPAPKRRGRPSKHK